MKQRLRGGEADRGGGSSIAAIHKFAIRDFQSLPLADRVLDGMAAGVFRRGGILARVIRRG